MNVIVVAVDVGKWLGPLHYSSLTKHREPLLKCFRWSPISLNPEPAIGINSFTEAVIRSPPFFTPALSTRPVFFPSIFPPHLQTTIRPSIQPFLHFFTSASPQSLARPLHPSSAHSPRPLFSSLHPRSVSIFPSRPCYETDAALIGTF